MVSKRTKHIVVGTIEVFDNTKAVGDDKANTEDPSENIVVLIEDTALVIGTVEDGVDVERIRVVPKIGIVLEPIETSIDANFDIGIEKGSTPDL